MSSEIRKRHLVAGSLSLSLHSAVGQPFSPIGRGRFTGASIRWDYGVRRQCKDSFSTSHMLVAHWAICSLPIEPYAHCPLSHMLVAHWAICSLPIEPYAHCPLSHMLVAHWAICSLPIEPYAHCLSSHMLLFPPEYIFLIFSDLASRFPAFINCNSRHLAGSHPKKVDCQAKVVPSLFTGYGPLDRQESGRILCQDRICHHHS